MSALPSSLPTQPPIDRLPAQQNGQACLTSRPCLGRGPARSYVKQDFPRSRPLPLTKYVAAPDLPAGGTVVKVHQLGLGEWCDTTKYDVKLPNETVARFFEKVDSGASPLDRRSILSEKARLRIRRSRAHHSALALGKQYSQVHSRVYPPTHCHRHLCIRRQRPLETGGRFIEPTLCHTDLWPGNVKYRLDGKSPLVFDANALWGHSEMELGLFRNPRYPLEMPFLEGYLRKVPVAEPAEDFECRNIVHMLRYQICLASVYPDEADLRKV